MIRIASSEETTAIIDRLWTMDEPKVFIPKEQYVQNLEGYVVKVYEAQGEIALVAFIKGPAFHFHNFGIIPISMKLTRGLIQAIIDEHGYATTKTPKDTEFDRQHRFNKLIGFFETGEDEYDVFYRIERMYGCQS